MPAIRSQDAGATTLGDFGNTPSLLEMRLAPGI
jgi:hypothetical protein